jgi:hypothetical protein
LESAENVFIPLTAYPYPLTIRPGIYVANIAYIASTVSGGPDKKNERGNGQD